MLARSFLIQYIQRVYFSMKSTQIPQDQLVKFLPMTQKEKYLFLS